MAIRDFSDEEMRLLARVIRREQQAVQSPRNQQQKEDQDWLAPEVYIAKLTADVTALVAGVDGAADQPSYTTADIYRIVTGDSGSPELAIAFETTRRIYNITSSSVSADDYIAVVRDKYGNWIAVQGGGSPTKLVEITQYENNFNTGTGTASGDCPDTSVGTALAEGLPVEIHRDNTNTGTQAADGVCVRDIDCDGLPTGVDYKAYIDESMRGVHYTGSRVRVQWSCGEWKIVSPGDTFWGDAVTLEAIAADASGSVSLFDGGPVVLAFTDTGIATETPCDVSWEETGKRFKITAQRCPTTPATGTA